MTSVKLVSMMNQQAKDVSLSYEAQMHCSDSDKRSLWSRKIILSLDGGGIRGYSSVLILKRLMYVIEQIECGEMDAWSETMRTPVDIYDLDVERENRYVCRRSSWEYPWHNPRFVQASDKSESSDSVQGPYYKLADELKNTFEHKSTSFKPCHYFDYIVGTSTGGLTAIMLARLNLDVESCFEIYDSVGSQVFGRPRMFPKMTMYACLLCRKYSSTGMQQAIEKVIETYLEDELRQQRKTTENVAFSSDPQRCRCVAVSNIEHLKQPYVSNPYLFRTYDHLSPYWGNKDNITPANPGHANKEPIWFVARATTAAPGYFSAQRSADGNKIYRDGGIGANNPAEMALTEVRQMHEQSPLLLLSVGTGKPPEDSDLPRKVRSAALAWLDAASLLQRPSRESEEAHQRMAQELSEIPESDEKLIYHRLSVDQHLHSILLDEWQPKHNGMMTKEIMKFYTLAYLARPEVDQSIRECARELVRIRRGRAMTDRWESYACNFVYRCPEDSCTQKGRVFSERRDLRRHATEAHRYVLDVPTSPQDGATATNVCHLDDCLHNGIHVFSSREAYMAHLEESHGIQVRNMRTRQNLEAWLDCGRMTREELFQEEKF